jgi:RHS repeat-associated protein
VAGVRVLEVASMLPYADNYRARYYDQSIGRFLSEDPLRFAVGGANFYPYALNSPTDFVDPSGRTWQTNWNFFWNWVRGTGDRTRDYGPNDVETQEIENSPGAEAARNAFYRAHCRTIRKRIGYGTAQAYWDTIADPLTADWSSTAAQVGGFGGASAINNGDGTVTYIIPNVAGTHSFFFHLVPDRSSPTGWMSNIDQVFHWTEPIDPTRNCGCK